MQSILSKSIHQVSLIPFTHSKYPAWCSYPNTPPEPGGYLEWEGVDEETYISNNKPVIWEIGDVFDSALKAQRKSSRASAKVRDECIGAGFADVVRLTYSSERDSSLPGRLDTELRLGAIIETLYASLLLRSGQVGDEEEASSWARKFIEEHRRLCQYGNSSPSRLMRVVGRKRLRSSRL